MGNSLLVCDGKSEKGGLNIKNSTLPFLFFPETVSEIVHSSPPESPPPKSYFTGHWQDLSSLCQLKKAKMNGIFTVKKCGNVGYAHDTTTQGVIGKRTVELGDWLGDRTGSFEATAWGSTAYADLHTGDIIYAYLILRTYGEMNLITLAGFVKIGHETMDN